MLIYTYNIHTYNTSPACVIQISAESKRYLLSVKVKPFRRKKLQKHAKPCENLSGEPLVPQVLGHANQQVSMIQKSLDVVGD